MDDARPETRDEYEKRRAAIVAERIKELTPPKPVDPERANNFERRWPQGRDLF